MASRRNNRRPTGPQSALSAKLSQVSKKVNKLAGAVETKYLPYTFSNTGVGTAGLLFNNVCQIGVGDTNMTRQGNRISPISLDIRYLLESEVADAFNQFRVMVVKSKIGVLLAADMPSVTEHVTPDMRAKFTVLYDRVHLLQSMTSGTATDPLISTRYSGPFSKHLKLRGSIKYDPASANTEADALYVWMVSDSVAVNHPDVEQWDSILKFKDD